MNVWRVGSLNINGGRDKNKLAKISEFLRIEKVNVCFLQETHTDIDNEIEWGLWWKGKFALSHDTRNSAGVAILFSKSVSIVKVEEIVKGRLLLTQIEYNGIESVYLNVYAPNNGPERLIFFMELRKVLKKLDDNVCLIIGGDWNCTIDFVVDRNGEEPHSKSRDVLKKVINEFQLTDVWRTRNEGVKQYTWLRVVDNKISGARLDRFYLKKIWSNKVMNTFIRPNGFSDHHMVILDINLEKTRRCNYYWIFNIKLLHDVSFCEKFKVFWDIWKLKKNSFENLSQWWDVGKTNIKMFCQNYAFHSSSILNATVKVLQSDIESIERQAVNNNEVVQCHGLNEKRQELSSLLHEQAKGALVRSRYCSVKEMDAPSAFFFNLEKKHVQQKMMCHLRRSDGSVTSDPTEMRRMTGDFYKLLYTAESCDIDCTKDLLKDLPQLEEEQKKELDDVITFHEVTEAMRQLSNGRSPGIDGLPVEFYRHFWDLIGPDIYEVILECIKNNALPMSCRRAVLSLLPKKGDLGLLKNWRPVSLLCLDYKIVSKVLANRLKHCLDLLIKNDQTYCIPKRSIIDSLFLVRDIIEFNQKIKKDLGVLSLDQEKAFDRVDHEYLFKVLKGYGFGDVFISYIKLLYSNVYVMVKVGGGLSAPIPVTRGIRQGCPISGQLYSLIIETLLCRLRKNLNGILIPHGNGHSKVVLSAYADDITVFITEKEDIEILTKTIELYEKASSAKVNWTKSEGFMIGNLENFPQLPGRLQWKKDGLKILGVFLGNDQFQKKNWEGLVEKVSARLSKWRWLLPQLSYRGRVLVVNNLAASILWHRTMVMEPPEELISSIQKEIVKFFWDGQHWLRAAVLYLPVQEGGQGLVDVRNRVRGFRIQAAQRFLYDKDVLWGKTASVIMRRVGGLGLDKQLFLMKLEEMNLSELTVFYRTMLQTWRIVIRAERNMDNLELWAPEEPLFFNPLIQTRILTSVTVRQRLIRNGIVKLDNLLNDEGWKSSDELQEATGLRSSRLVSKLKEEINNVLPSGYRSFIAQKRHENNQDKGDNVQFPELVISPAMKEDDEEEMVDNILSFWNHQFCSFKSISKKEIYNITVKAMHQDSFRKQKVSKWPDLLRPDFLTRDRWRALYKPPVEKRSGDLQWRIIYGAIATDGHVAHLNSAVKGECRFCGKKEDLEHLFLKCERLKGLFNLIGSWFRKFDEEFSEMVFIGGIKYSFLKRKKMCLLNYIIGTAKLAVWKTRKNKGLNLATIDPEEMCKRLVAERLNIEFAYYRLTNNLFGFGEIWCIDEVLCMLQEDQFVLNF